MDKKNTIISKYNFLFFLLFLCIICFVDCIIEIPIKIIGVNNNEEDKYNINKNITEYHKTIELKEVNEGSLLLLGTSFLFIATIKIGSNNQQFNVILDTGSSELWVANIDSFDNNAQIPNHFNTSDSSTCVNTTETFMQMYGESTITGCIGFYFTDNIKYFNDISFNMKFGVADMTDFNIKNVDGVLGIAHEYKDESLSFMKMLLKANNINLNQFSFKFPSNNITLNGTIGQLLIGKHKDFESNKVVTCPLLADKMSENGYWICEISGLGLKNNKGELNITKSYKKFIFDTGTNLLTLPMDFLKQIEKDLDKIGCRKKNLNGSTRIECLKENYPSLTFNIGGTILNLPPRYLYTSQNVSRYYFLDSDYYMIGSPFFVTFHTLFDKDNEVLQFYTDYNYDTNKGDTKKLEPEKDEKKTDSLTGLIILIIIVIVVLLFIVVGGLLIYFYISKKKEDKKVDDLLNYNVNNDDDNDNDLILT